MSIKLTTLIIMLTLSAQRAWTDDDVSSNELKYGAALSTYLRAAQQTETLGRRTLAPAVLLRWAENLNKAAETQFLIDQGSGSGERTKAIYVKMLEPLNLILKKENLSPDMMVDTLVFRAHALRELGRNEQAISDYAQALKMKPSLPKLVYFSLIDLLLAKKDFSSALQYIKAANIDPANRDYSWTQSRLAYTLDGLKRYDQAIEEVFRIAKFSKDKSERESALNRVAEYYAKGSVANPSDFLSRDAYSYFKNLTSTLGESSGVALAQVSKSYAIELRSSGLDQQLTELNSVTIQSEVPQETSVAVGLITASSMINSRKYDEFRMQMIALSKRIDDRGLTSPNKVEQGKSLFEMSKKLQAVFENAESPQQKAVTGPALLAVNEILIKSKAVEGSSVQAIVFNQGEILFGLRKYEESVKFYFWVLNRAKSQPQDKSSGELVAKSKSRLIGARYEALKASGVFPDRIDLLKVSQEAPRELPQEAKEWLGWVESEPTDSFAFEANRLLYSYGNTTEAIRRMRKFSEVYPTSKYTLPSAEMVLDTALLNGDWLTVIQSVDQFKKISGLNQQTDFRAKMNRARGDATVKVMEVDYRQKNFEQVVKVREGILPADLSDFPQQRQNEIATIAAASALAIGKWQQADSWIRPALNYYAQSKERGSLAADVFMTARSIAEFRFDFLESAHIALLQIKSEKDKQISNVSDEGDALKLRFASKLPLGELCGHANESECHLYQALDAIRLGNDVDVKKASAMSAKAGPGGIAAWNAIALQKYSGMSLLDRASLVKRIAGDIQNLESSAGDLVRVSLLKTFEGISRSGRTMVRSAATLSTNPTQSLAKRIGSLGQLEKSFEPIFNFPLIEGRILALRELSGAYDDLVRDWSDQAGGTLTDPQAVQVRQTLADKSASLKARALALASEYGMDLQLDRTWASPAPSLGGECPRCSVWAEKFKSALDSKDYYLAATLVQAASSSEVPAEVVGQGRLTYYLSTGLNADAFAVFSGKVTARGPASTAPRRIRR